MSRPTVVTTCMLGSSESWLHQQQPYSWHSRAGGGAVHSINSGHQPSISLKKQTRTEATRDRGKRVNRQRKPLRKARHFSRAFLVSDADWGRRYLSCLMPELCEAGLLSFCIVSLAGEGVLLMAEPVAPMFNLAFVFGLPAWSACVPVEVEVLLPLSVTGAAKALPAKRRPVVTHQTKFIHD
jgi:hypothetical protein